MIILMTKNQDLTKISAHQFYFETPLYSPILISDIEEIFEGEVDAHSVKYGSDTTYLIDQRTMDDGQQNRFVNFYKIRLLNKRKADDKLYFFVLVGSVAVIKVGQYPSLADLQLKQIDKKYKDQLNKVEIKEFKKAIGLAAHGEGAGSFVHLRRVFEGLIKESFMKHKSELAMTEQEFLGRRMVEKVEVLQNYLPSELLQMKEAYTILSQGVHELSEDECKEYFPILKLSIELILDEKIEAEAKEQRSQAVKRQLAAINAHLRSQKTDKG